MEYLINKRKIINDPVYGFISIPGDFIFDLIEHPWFQRLRNIKQVGLTHLVYPGANHTRFSHCLGALHLTDIAIQTLRNKNIEITDEEEEATLTAILLHDIGHGPFSHALEHSIVKDVSHEEISLSLIRLLNEKYNGRLDLAIDIFSGTYHKTFLHELISGQVDMDRLDYLCRDSFFTGVIEGNVGADRIIRMLNVVDNKLVIEEKGIYSIEKFLIARHLMYWQVYMHKTVISSERILCRLLKRAGELAGKHADIDASPALKFFLYNQIDKDDFSGTGRFPVNVVAENFTLLDDSDIMVAAKYWTKNADFVLSDFSRRLINRCLFAIELQDSPFTKKDIEEKKAKAKKTMGYSDDIIDYFVFSDSVYNRVYSPSSQEVGILTKKGDVKNISSVYDLFNHETLMQPKIKYFLCYPKECRQQD